MSDEKKRGRPKKVQDSIADNSIKDSQTSQSSVPLTNYLSVFKRINGITNTLVERKIVNYTETEIEEFLDNPIQNQRVLTDISNQSYLQYGFYQELISFYIKPALYRFTVNTIATNANMEKIKPDKVRKDFVQYSNKVKNLNLDREFRKILLKTFLEDAVFGYWLEDSISSTLYYFPSNWCILSGHINGNWTYKINTKAISQKEFEKLPLEIQLLVKQYRDKMGEAAYAPVPNEKCFCIKYNDHLSYSAPPFLYAVLLAIGLFKTRAIELSHNEQEAMNLIQMLIPSHEDQDDHLLFTERMISDFVSGVQDLLPESNAVIPTPMELSVLDTNKNKAGDKNIVKNAIDSFGEETGMPSFGGGNSAAEMKRAIENAASKVFNLYDQISSWVNLKMKLDGYISSGYEFEYELLHMNIFNEIETQDIILKQAQSGAVNKFRLAASYGLSPDAFIGQHYVENIVFRDLFDNLVVPPSTHTQSGNSGDGGRPVIAEDDLSPSGAQTRDNGSNDSANRDV